MTTAQVQCFGCNRNFTPNGLSQHFSKSPDPRCHDARSVSRQVELVSAPFPRTASPAPNPDHVSPGSGRVKPDDLDVPNYSLGRRNDDSETDGHDGTLSPGSGRVSPDDLGMHNYDLGRQDDEMDRHNGTQSPDGGFSAACVAI